MKNICKRLLLKMCSWNETGEKLKHSYSINYTIRKQVFSTFISEISENVYFDFMAGFSWSLYSDTIFLRCREKQTPNTTYLLELIKRRSKVQKNMSWKRALNFDQWKKFSANYKPVRVWVCLVYKFTENHCCLSSLSSFKLKRVILPLLKKYASYLEKYVSYQAKIFLVN